MSDSRRHSRRTARAPRAILIALAFVAAAAIGAFAFLHTSAGDSLERRIASQITVGGKPLNLLIIANNARHVAANKPLGLGSAAGQADVLIVLHVDPLQRGIWAITIPRDALVAQPHWHNPVPKIKTLFFMGDQESPPQGPQLTMRAVSQLTGMPIDGYLAINFAGFEEAVDFVGGLDLNVRERLYDPQNSGADFKPGLQHMNGKQVLAFVRIRQNIAGNTYRVNDYQRMDAEVSVLGLLRAKLLDPRTAAFLLPRFVDHMRPDIATNLSQDRLLRLAFAMVDVPVTEVSLDDIHDSMTLAGAAIDGIDADGKIDEASYDVLDPQAICKRLRRFGARNCSAGLPTPAPPHDVPVAVFGTADLLETLHRAGYAKASLAGPPTGERLVIYPASDPAGGWTLARALPGGDTTVEPGGSDATMTIRE